MFKLNLGKDTPHSLTEENFRDLGQRTEGYSGADIGPLVEQGVLGLGVQMDMTGYWPIHHTRADTIEKIDPQALRKNVAVMAVTAWWLAESPDLPLE